MLILLLVFMIGLLGKALCESEMPVIPEPDHMLTDDTTESPGSFDSPFSKLPSMNFAAIENNRHDKVVIFYDAKTITNDEMAVIQRINDSALITSLDGVPFMVVERHTCPENEKVFNHPVLQRKLPIVYAVGISDGIAEDMNEKLDFTFENIEAFVHSKFVTPDLTDILKFSSEEDMLDYYQADHGKVHHMFIFRKEEDSFSDNALRAVGKFMYHYKKSMEGEKEPPYKIRVFDVMCEFTGDHAFEMSIENKYNHNRYIKSYCNRLGLEGFPILMLLANGYYSMFDIRRPISAARIDEWLNRELLMPEVWNSRETLHTNLYSNLEPRVQMEPATDRHWRSDDDLDKNKMLKEWPPRERVAPMRAEIERLQLADRDVREMINNVSNRLFDFSDETKKVEDEVKDEIKQIKADIARIMKALNLKQKDEL